MSRRQRPGVEDVLTMRRQLHSNAFARTERRRHDDGVAMSGGQTWLALAPRV